MKSGEERLQVIVPRVEPRGLKPASTPRTRATSTDVHCFYNSAKHSPASLGFTGGKQCTIVDFNPSVLVRRITLSFPWKPSLKWYKNPTPRQEGAFLLNSSKCYQCSNVFVLVGLYIFTFNFGKRVFLFSYYVHFTYIFSLQNHNI